MRLVCLAMVGACSFRAGAVTHVSDAEIPDDPPPIDMQLVDGDPLADSAPAAPWLATHTYRKAVRITPNGPNASLAGFPIAFRERTDPDLVSRARIDGTDIVFTGDDGTSLLDHELAYYDAITGEVEAWVAIPTLQLDTATWIFVYYGGPVAVSTAAAVWGNSYKGVWHMSGAGALAAGEVDSSANANNLGQPSPLLVAGAGAGAAAPGVTIGRARVFDGTDDSLTVADPANGSLDVGSTAFAVSMWLNQVQANLSYDTPLYKGGTNPNNPGYSIFAGTSGWAGKIMDQTFAFINPTFSTTPVTGAWSHIVMSIQRTPSNEATAYLNGVETQKFAFNLQSFDGTAPLWIGASPTQPFRGSIDEVRIYSRPVPGAWVKAEWANLAKSDFITIGSQQMQ